jgi:DNA-binding CsgD family transcriptional regulator
VALSQPPDLYELTPVQLQILGLLVKGWPNARTAAALGLTQRAVATHLAHIRAKLGALTWAVAALRAVRQGLYVPRPLTHTRE